MWGSVSPEAPLTADSISCFKLLSSVSSAASSAISWLKPGVVMGKLGASGEWLVFNKRDIKRSFQAGLAC